GEWPIIQIRCCGIVTAYGRSHRTPSVANPLQAKLAQEASDALASHAHADLAQLEMDPRRTVDAMRGGMDLADPFTQGCIASGSRRGWPPQPRMVAAGGDTQHTAHGGDRIDGLVRLHESESLD